MNTYEATVADATEAALLSRISVLLQRRAVDRRVFGAAWPQARWDRHTELRALIAVARSGRRLAEARPDPIDAAKSYHDWTSGELSEAFGR